MEVPIEDMARLFSTIARVTDRTVPLLHRRVELLETLCTVVDAFSGCLLVITRRGNKRVVRAVQQRGLAWRQRELIISSLAAPAREPWLEPLFHETDKPLLAARGGDALGSGGFDHWEAAMLGDMIFVGRRTPAGSVIAIGLFRGSADHPFSEQERQLLSITFDSSCWHLFEPIEYGAEGSDGEAEFSERMREVLLHLHSGKTPEEIGRLLHISRHTVYDHIKKMHRMLGVSSRTQLLAVTRSMLSGAAPDGIGVMESAG